MEWEKSSRSIDPVDTFLHLYDEIVEKEWEAQPDADLWIIPPRTRLTTQAIKNYRQRGVDYLGKYIPRCLDAPWEISHIEQTFEIELGGVLVKGGVDRILYYPAEDEYVIEDLKTGNLKGEEDVRQLGFYAFVARELWDIPVREGRYWFARLDRGSEFTDLTRFDKEYWETQFARLDSGINQHIFLSNPGDSCGICAVRPWCSTMGTKQVGEPL